MTFLEISQWLWSRFHKEKGRKNTNFLWEHKAKQELFHSISKMSFFPLIDVYLDSFYPLLGHFGWEKGLKMTSWTYLVTRCEITPKLTEARPRKWPLGSPQTSQDLFGSHFRKRSSLYDTNWLTMLTLWGDSLAIFVSCRWLDDRA